MHNIQYLPTYLPTSVTEWLLTDSQPTGAGFKSRSGKKFPDQTFPLHAGCAARLEVDWQAPIFESRVNPSQFYRRNIFSVGIGMYLRPKLRKSYLDMIYL